MCWTVCFQVRVSDNSIPTADWLRLAVIYTVCSDKDQLDFEVCKTNTLAAIGYVEEPENRLIEYLRLFHVH